MKTYDKYKSSGIDWIGDIPQGWQILLLKYLVSTKITDGPHETPQILTEGVPFVSAESVRDGKIDFNLKRGYISEEQDLIYSKKCKPKRNDVFIIKSGSTTGNIAFVDFDDDFNIWSPLALVRTNNDKAFSRYIFHFLQTDFFQDQVRFSWSFGTQPNIGMNVIENLKIIVPPISEQTAIAEYLDEKTAQIDKLIAEKRRLIELLKEERLGVINQAVTRGINPHAKLKPSGIAWLGDIPEHWEVKKLKYLTKEKLKYGANESAELEDFEQPRYIRITDFGENGMLRDDTFRSLPKEVAEDYLLQEGDVLFARSGATVGKTFQFKNYKGLACFAGYLIKASPNENEILSDFLYLFTRSGLYENWKNSIFIQATIQNIGADKYSLLEITLPPIEEQKQIVEFIETATGKIDATIATIEKEIGFLREYRTALISEVVTGKIKVTDN